jgi:hypothetical protein
MFPTGHEAERVARSEVQRLLSDGRVSAMGTALTTAELSSTVDRRG